MADGSEEKKDKRESAEDVELDFNAVMADLSRQAHDKELEALASLTLLRSTFDSPDGMSPTDREQKDLDERLKKIISDLSQD